MAGVTAHGGTFTYSADLLGSFSATVAGISVETPQAVVVDMTPVYAPASAIVMVPTGEWTGGSISVDYIHAAGGFDPQRLVRSYGTLTFGSAGYGVERTVVLESATTEAKVGDIVRGTLKFRMTDYTG